MDRTQVLERLEPMTQLKGRVVEGDFKISYSQPDGTFAVRPGKSCKTQLVEPSSIESLLRFAGVGADLSKRLTMTSLGNVVDESIRAREQGAFSILSRDNTVVDIGPASEFKTIAPERVLKKIEAGIREDVQYHNVLMLPNHTVRIETLGVQERAVAVDDLVRAGTMTQFSPLGTTLPMVQAFNMRLVCTNGAVATEVMKEFKYARGGGAGEGDDIWQFFQKANREAYRAIDKVVERYQQLMAEEVPDDERAAIINALLKQMRAPKEVVAAVQARALTTPPQNSWDVFNLATWASSHVLEEPVRIATAQRAIANWSSEDSHARICPTCNHSAGH